MDEATFKCRKCRHILFTSENVIPSHNAAYDKSTNMTVCEDLENEKHVWFLKDDVLEEWMEKQIDQGNWIKGKLCCPTCSNRIGSYDFVSGSQCTCGIVLPAIHVVKSKIDFELKSEIDSIKGKIHSPPVVNIHNLNTLALEGTSLAIPKETVSQISHFDSCMMENVEGSDLVPENDNLNNMRKEKDTFQEGDKSKAYL
ncbi:E3 ubiquitin-protein ligase RNF180-like isoform X2 [Centruroides sculpturatus]|uniref:E3 ubiquitin-protein ligase RNF180-like isoform X1 n=1 Tax=Centruroides sculpturatus TaxID=218467 RepID=UPI000C6EFB4D|nr:E3 ubiquitin-protein ligase RNF180-like isoform X1 [Centruroides sculpturatus]XP_023218339.1 E3 ubiquitin-protein ligase RNF180-like isoform X2 [Centruroides sculpturatus]